MSASKMTQGQSSRRVLMGARGKTPSGVSSNRHPRKRSFLQMIKSAANTVLLLIFVSRTAHCSSYINAQVDVLKRELQDMMRQELQGLEYLSRGQREEFTRLVDHIKKLCSSSPEFELINKLSASKSDYSRMQNRLKALVKHNTVKKELKPVDDGKAAQMFKGLTAPAARNNAYGFNPNKKFAPVSSETSRPSKGRSKKEIIRALAKASGKTPMHAIAQQATRSQIAKRSRDRFSRDQRKKKGKLQAEIDNLVKEIEAIAEDHEKRVKFYDSHVEQDVDWLDTWRRMSVKIMEDKILANDAQLKSLNLRLKGLLNQMHEKYHKLKKDEIVAFTGLDNDAPTDL